MKFAWDQNKRKKNLAKHWIDFADAALIFYDNNRIEAVDDRDDYGETIYFYVWFIQKEVSNIE